MRHPHLRSRIPFIVPEKKPLRERLKHAFAVDPPGEAAPTPEQAEVVEWLCVQVAKRRLTTPGLMFLEMGRPLNWITAQGMHVLSPGVWALMRQQSYANYRHFIAFLEQRGSIDYLCRRIEELEEEAERRERGSETTDEHR